MGPRASQSDITSLRRSIPSTMASTTSSSSTSSTENLYIRLKAGIEDMTDNQMLIGLIVNLIPEDRRNSILGSNHNTSFAVDDDQHCVLTTTITYGKTGRMTFRLPKTYGELFYFLIHRIGESNLTGYTHSETILV